jgi:hypothetical protein
MMSNISGHAVITIRWTVQGGGDGDTVTVDSVKGGYLSAPVVAGGREKEK